MDAFLDKDNGTYPAPPGPAPRVEQRVAVAPVHRHDLVQKPVLLRAAGSLHALRPLDGGTLKGCLESQAPPAWSW